MLLRCAHLLNYDTTKWLNGMCEIVAQKAKGNKRRVKNKAHTLFRRQSPFTLCRELIIFCDTFWGQQMDCIPELILS